MRNDPPHYEPRPAVHRLLSSCLWIVLLAFVLAAGTAHGAISAETSDDCARTGYSPAQLTYSHTDALTDGWMIWDVYIQPGTTFFACARRSLIIVGNQVATPAVGSAAIYTGTVDALRTYFRAHETWLRPSAIINASGVCYRAAAGVSDPWRVGACAAKPAQHLYGWYLTDSPIAYVTYQVSSPGPRSGPPGQLLLPFKVGIIGSGGWLSIGYKGQEFWRQPLSVLTAGQWYQASVPVSSLNGADPVFTIYLESTGATMASIFVPTESMLSVDSDGDGIVDGLDNCITTPNPSQRDADHDGYGNTCDADLNNSGTVTTSDYLIMRSRLNTTDPAADLNDSGRVTSADYMILRGRLNTVPGPSGLTP